VPADEALARIRARLEAMHKADRPGHRVQQVPR
jgi:hypothetical protein